MTSADFFYTVVSAAVIILTVFGTIALYHLIIILKRIHEVCDIFELKTERFFQTFHDLATRLMGLKATFDVFGNALKAILSSAQNHRKTSGSKKKNKSQEGEEDE